MEPWVDSICGWSGNSTHRTGAKKYVNRAANDVQTVLCMSAARSYSFPRFAIGFNALYNLWAPITE